MAHVRKTIRDAVVTSLTNLTTTGSNVFNTRVFPIAQASLPCLTVTSEGESVDQDTLDGQMFRSVSIVVRAVARAVANVEDTMDTIAAEVETAFSPGASAKDWMLESTDFDFDGDGDNQYAIVTMQFIVQYVTERSAPETAL